MDEACEAPLDAAIPVLDLRALGGPAEARARCVSALGAAAARDGIAYLIGHGVDDALLGRARAQAAALFDLAPEEKLRLLCRDGMRGYRPVPRQRGADDRKECYFCEVGMAQGAPAGSRLLGDNRWPALAGFEATMRAAIDAVGALGRRLVDAFEEQLGAPGELAEAFRAGAGVGLRVLRYPPFDGDAGWLGANEHVDLPAFGLLDVGDVPGLEYRDAAGRWRAVEPRPGALLLQIGALLERWTNGVHRACVHRVSLRAARARDSMAFFVQPALGAEIRCVSTCAGPGRPAPKAPIRYRDYFEQWIGDMDERSTDGALLDASRR